MDAEQFRKAGHELIDWIADYYANVDKYKVLPEPQAWADIWKDVESLIMPGVTHWQSPNFMAFFPANGSFPAILGELLSAGLGVQGMLWITSPACTELEVVVLDWLARLMQLPKDFTSEGTGGGAIHGTASEALLCSVVAARHRTAIRLGLEADAALSSRLVVYGSTQTHSSLTKACKIAGIHLDNLRLLDVDPSTLALQPETFTKAVEADKAKGLIPIFLCTTFGTTSTTATDPFIPLGQFSNKEHIWMHIDAAYAGSALICPEYRPLVNGIEFADSFNFNPHKWLGVNFDCSAYWVKSRKELISAMSVIPVYLQNKASSDGEVIDYRDWQIPLGRRFRSLKLWFVLRNFGVAKLQEFIRGCVELAKEFEDWVAADSRFELITKRSLALICFRLKGSNELNQQLEEAVHADRDFYISHSSFNDKYFIRVSIGSPRTTKEHVTKLWATLTDKASKLLAAK